MIRKEVVDAPADHSVGVQFGECTDRASPHRLVGRLLPALRWRIGRLDREPQGIALYNDLAIGISLRERLQEPTERLEVIAPFSAAAGVVPTSHSLEVANRVLQLVKAGGSFVPASALSASREIADAGSSKCVDGGILTERQTAVVKKLALGKPNKVIAFELAMRESTVKVHVRTIMKKLQATNRTEVAFIYQSMQAD